jgi:hypothetical protein
MTCADSIFGSYRVDVSFRTSAGLVWVTASAPATSARRSDGMLKINEARSSAWDGASGLGVGLAAEGDPALLGTEDAEQG